MEIILIAASLVGVGAAFFVGRKSKKTEIVEIYVPVRGERRNPRFRLTWKRGQIFSDDLTAVSQEIVKLREAGQPYEYYMDGKQIYPKR